MLFLSPRYYPDLEVDLISLGQIEDREKRAKELLDKGLITEDEYKKLAGPAERVEELRVLKEKGLLTEDEFERLTKPPPSK